MHRKRCFLPSCLLLLLLAFAGQIQAQQQSFSRHEVGVGIGHSHWLKGVRGLSLTDKTYQNSFDKSFTWNAHYRFWILRSLGVGMEYHGLTASNSHSVGDDRLYLAYAALVSTVRFYVLPRLSLRPSVGWGLVYLRNNGHLYGNSRDTRSYDVGFHLSGAVHYQFGPHWGAWADAQINTARPEAYRLHYHGESMRVHRGESKSAGLSRVHFSVGASYTF